MTNARPDTLVERLPSASAMGLLLSLLDADIAREGETHSTMVRAGLLRDILVFAITRIEADRPTVDGLVAALEPFAAKAQYADALEVEDGDYLECAPLMAGDYRKARAALAAHRSQESPSVSFATLPDDCGNFGWCRAAEGFCRRHSHRSQERDHG